ncbi:4'-phosphopantetheinyl transferase family protein [Rickettsiella grylli]|uniref:4'-phosphopantetheinyl transferase n=1 Tax=Rickettsiella grylli TaxID=59196 RepID=A8PPD6_9COXI|nr:4'-phosphopantetheinyl transferase superfamily protein [Rickettsiella grylli]EDP45735.1 4'-phosphopantetheinyl transferase [Rickettsiella grylli]
MRELNQPIIHIWHTQFEAHKKKYKHFHRWLSTEEKNRADKLTSIHREKFIISRGILRDLLAYYSKKSPQELKLSYSSFGKPLLTQTNAEHTIEFNLSHSKNSLAYAFTLNTPVGIDIEYIRQGINLDKIAYRFFSAEEYNRLQLLQGNQKLKVFFNIWVRTEALIKAKNYTLGTHPLSQYKRSLYTPLHLLRNQKKTNSHYALFNFPFYSNFSAAIAVKGRRKRIHVNAYTHPLSI